MRALWTEEEAEYDGEFVKFGPSWAWPKPVQAHIPVLVGAAGTEKNFKWIARVGRRLDHHAARFQHRRAGQAAAGHLGRRRPRRRTADRGARLQARPGEARALAGARRHRGALRPARQDRRRSRRATSSGSRASWPRWSETGAAARRTPEAAASTPWSSLVATRSSSRPRMTARPSRTNAGSASPAVLRIPPRSAKTRRRRAASAFRAARPARRGHKHSKKSRSNGRSSGLRTSAHMAAIASAGSVEASGSDRHLPALDLIDDRQQQLAP